MMDQGKIKGIVLIAAAVLVCIYLGTLV